MKIRVSFTLEVDAEAYAREYGIELDEVRSDVKENVIQRVYTDFANYGVLN